MSETLTEYGAGLGRRGGEFAFGLVCALNCVFSISPPSGTSWYPWLLVPLFGAATIHFMRRAFSPEARIAWGPGGVTDRTSILEGELIIPWENILGISPGGWDRAVHVQIRDMRELRRHAGLSRKAGILLRTWVGRRTIRLSPFLLGVNRRELHEGLEDAFASYERRKLGLEGNGPALPDVSEAERVARPRDRHIEDLNA